MTAGQPLTSSAYLTLCSWVQANNIHLKVNTVVTRANLREDMSEFIIQAHPWRWKIMQVLPVRGQNDTSVALLIVTRKEFLDFVERHKHTAVHGISIVFEDNASMTG